MPRVDYRPHRHDCRQGRRYGHLVSPPLSRKCFPCVGAAVVAVTAAMVAAAVASAMTAATAMTTTAATIAITVAAAESTESPLVTRDCYGAA